MLNLVAQMVTTRLQRVKFLFKKQSVNAVQGNNRCLFIDPHKTHKCTVWVECRIVLLFNLVVHIVTTGL